ncbi:hypothetical protein C8R45DRAFT_975724 [Mycena sanguinolenta]|nr:hypothetical protein C8R45DRAFT_975724 [Mycena sanguinolenta]
MSQLEARAPFVLPSVAATFAATHPALPVNLVQAFGLDAALPQGAVITSQAVQEAESLVKSIEASKILHAEFTDEVVQIAHDRAHMLSKIHAEATFNDPHTLQNILAAVLRVEARLDNAGIVKRNQLQLANDSGTTAYIARKKQVAGDGLALATALAGNTPVPPPQGNPAVGAVSSASIDPHAMTNAQILALIRFYNEDFGIIPTDPIPARLQKIMNWLIEPMF